MTASINMDTTTTTQSISQNDNFSLTSYSLQGFLQFLMHNSKQIIISMLFLLLAFGQTCTTNLDVTLSMSLMAISLQKPYRMLCKRNNRLISSIPNNNSISISTNYSH